jgi:tetratricopeptide (TPR) repeat protein
MRLRPPVAVCFCLLASLIAPVWAQQRFSDAGQKPYIERKDWQGLLRYDLAWTQAEPRNALAWYGLGMTYRVGFNRLDDATGAFRRATLADPEFMKGWEALAATYSIMPGRHNDVLQTLRGQAQHMSKATSNDWFQLGLNLDKSGSFMDYQPYREAIYAYNQSLRLNPNRAETWNNRGTAESSMGNYDAALSDFQRASNMGLVLGTKNYNGLRQALADQARAERAAAAARSSAMRLPGIKTCSVLIGDGAGNWHSESRSGSSCP